jgi:hypothetical protein
VTVKDLMEYLRDIDGDLPVLVQDARTHQYDWARVRIRKTLTYSGVSQVELESDLNHDQRYLRSPKIIPTVVLGGRFMNDPPRFSTADLGVTDVRKVKEALRKEILRGSEPPRPKNRTMDLD